MEGGEGPVDFAAPPPDLPRLAPPARPDLRCIPMPMNLPVEDTGLSLILHGFARSDSPRGCQLLGPPRLLRRGRNPLPQAAVEFFETSVRPVLIESCQKCHGPGKQSSGLRLDSREAILKGGDTGPAVVPGKPDESLLVQAVEQTHDELKMPPKTKLQSPRRRRAAAVGRDGSALGRSRAAGEHRGGPATVAARDHWAFTPVERIPPPRVQDPGWVRTPVDAFVLARLEKEGLTPSPRPTGGP